MLIVRGKTKMNEKKNLFLPQVNGDLPDKSNTVKTDEVIGDAPCPCCGYTTIPNKGDALAYICPVCFWEIDLFIESEEEPSDQNHGITLKEGRINFLKYGAVLPSLKQYCRKPKKEEYPK